MKRLFNLQNAAMLIVILLFCGDMYSCKKQLVAPIAPTTTFFKVYDFTSTNYSFSDDSGFIFIFDTKYNLIKLDANGKMIWKKQYYNSNHFMNIIAYLSGDYFYVVNQDTSDSHYHRLMTINKNGILICTTLFSTALVNIVNSYSLTGYSNGITILGNDILQQTRMLRFSSLGNPLLDTVIDKRLIEYCISTRGGKTVGVLSATNIKTDFRCRLCEFDSTGKTVKTDSISNWQINHFLNIYDKYYIIGSNDIVHPNNIKLYKLDTNLNTIDSCDYPESTVNIYIYPLQNEDFLLVTNNFFGNQYGTMVRTSPTLNEFKPNLFFNQDPILFPNTSYSINNVIPTKTDQIIVVGQIQSFGKDTQNCFIFKFNHDKTY